MTTITLPPDYPDIEDPQNFQTKAQAWVQWLSDEFAPALAEIIGTTIPAGSAAAGTLTGNTIAANVVNSSLTSLGTVTHLQATRASLGSSSKFTSNAQTITSDGTLTIAHGLAAAPIGGFIKLTCTSADGGYSVGHVIYKPWGTFADGGSGRGADVRADATNLYIHFGANASVFAAMDGTSTGLNSLTNAKWTATFIALAF